MSPRPWVWSRLCLTSVSRVALVGVVQGRLCLTSVSRVALFGVSEAPGPGPPIARFLLAVRILFGGALQVPSMLISDPRKRRNQRFSAALLLVSAVTGSSNTFPFTTGGQSPTLLGSGAGCRPTTVQYLPSVSGRCLPTHTAATQPLNTHKHTQHTQHTHNTHNTHATHTCNPRNAHNKHASRSQIDLKTI